MATWVKQTAASAAWVLSRPVTTWNAQVGSPYGLLLALVRPTAVVLGPVSSFTQQTPATTNWSKVTPN